MYQNIIVGYDGSKSSEIALKQAAALAKEFGASLTMLCACPPWPGHVGAPDEFEENAEILDEYFKARCEEAKKAADEQNIAITCARSWSDAADGVVRFADKGHCDLIVIGHSNHSELWGRLLGDTADQIADRAQCSVLIVKDREAA